MEILRRERHKCNAVNLRWDLVFPSWNGYLYAIDAFNGSLVWEKNLQELTGLNGTGAIANVPKNVTVSRTTPTVVDDLLIIGIYGPAVVIAVDRGTGNLVWSTQLDSNPLAVITMSGTPHQRLPLSLSLSLHKDVSDHPRSATHRYDLLNKVINRLS